MNDKLHQYTAVYMCCCMQHLWLQAAYRTYIPMLCHTKWWWEGGRRGHAPQAALYRGGIWRSKICNSESWLLLVNSHLHCRQWNFYTLLTLPSFGTTPFNCQCSTTPYKAVCTPRNLHCWSDWSFTSCKTV